MGNHRETIPNLSSTSVDGSNRLSFGLVSRETVPNLTQNSVDGLDQSVSTTDTSGAEDSSLDIQSFSSLESALGTCQDLNKAFCENLSDIRVSPYAQDMSDFNLPFESDSPVPLLDVTEARSELEIPNSATSLEADLNPSVHVDSSEPLPFGAFIPMVSPDDPWLNTDVVNLSSARFTRTQLEALEWMVKCRQSSKHIPFLQLIAAVETAAREIAEVNGEKVAWFRAECARVISRATPSAPNIPVRYTRLLNDLSRNPNIVVLSSDKGGKLVVLDQCQYAEMCLTHLEDRAYQKVSSFGSGKSQVDLQVREFAAESFRYSDPYDKLVLLQCKELSLLLTDLKRHQQISVEERCQLLPHQPYSGQVPKFYGLPKIHKQGQLKIRPIIATSGYHADKLMLKQKNILNLLIWGNTTLTNTYEFVKLIENFQFGQEDKLLSFDVESLFTRVPIKEALEVVGRRLEQMRQLSTDPIK